MPLISSLVAVSLVARQSQREGFILPSLEKNRIELNYVQVGERPKLLWQRNQSLYANEDDNGIKGNQWIASNLMITLSPSGNSVYLPFVFFEDGWIELGGTVLTRSGKLEELPRFNIQNHDDLTLYYGWNGEHPSIVEEKNLERSGRTFEGGKWGASSSIPATLRSLDTPASFLGSPISGPIMFSDSWQCSLPPARDNYRKSLVLMGSRGGFLAASSHTEVMIFEKGVALSSLFTGTENVIPLSGGRIVGRVLSSNKPRDIFTGFWADPSDPFIDSEVFLFDLRSGKKTLLGKGLYGLPVLGEWKFTRG